MKPISLVCIAALICLSSCSAEEAQPNNSKSSSSKPKSKKMVSLFEDPHPVEYKPKNKKKLVNFKDYIEAAREAEDQSAYTDGSRLAKKAMELKPNSGVAHYYYGKCQIAAPLGNSKRGLEYLEKAAELGYENPDMYEYMAVQYTGMKLPEKAIEALNNGLRLAPKRKSYYKFRGSLYRQTGQIEKAEKDYTKILSLPKGSKSKEYFLRGRFYESLGKNDLAMKDYRAAAAAPRPEYMVLKAIPKLLAKMGKDDEAIEELSKVIEIDPYDDDSVTFRGKLYLKKNEYKKALSDFNKAINNSPRYARETYLARAELFDKMNKPDKAQRDRNTAKSIKDRPAEKPVYNFSK